MKPALGNWQLWKHQNFAFKRCRLGFLKLTPAWPLIIVEGWSQNAFEFAEMFELNPPPRLVLSATPGVQHKIIRGVL